MRRVFVCVWSVRAISHRQYGPAQPFCCSASSNGLRDVCTRTHNIIHTCIRRIRAVVDASAQCANVDVVVVILFYFIYFFVIIFLNIMKNSDATCFGMYSTRLRWRQRRRRWWRWVPWTFLHTISNGTAECIILCINRDSSVHTRYSPTVPVAMLHWCLKAFHDRTIPCIFYHKSYCNKSHIYSTALVGISYGVHSLKKSRKIM